jgi:hypothetical protein
VAIEDVVTALVAALDMPVAESAAFDLPGPEVLSGAQILDQTAKALGLPPATKIEVPFLTPRLSSLWVRFVTRARWSVARQVVVGLTHDLLAKEGQELWPRIGHPPLMSFADAAHVALAAEGYHRAPGAWGLVERWRREAARAFG